MNKESGNKEFNPTWRNGSCFADHHLLPVNIIKDQNHRVATKNKPTVCISTVCVSTFSQDIDPERSASKSPNNAELDEVGK